MSFDWLKELVPILNAAGLPLLAVAIGVLIRAYAKAMDTYKSSALELQNENDRLRRTIAKLDDNLYQSHEKTRTMLEKSAEAIDRLQVQRIRLNRNEEADKETQKITQLIEMLISLQDTIRKNENIYQEIFRSSISDIEHIKENISALAAKVNDPPSKTAILHTIVSSSTVSISNNSQQDIYSEIGDSRLDIPSFMRNLKKRDVDNQKVEKRHSNKTGVPELNQSESDVDYNK